MRVKNRRCIGNRGGSQYKTQAFKNSRFCFFCSCEMNENMKSPHFKTREHIIPRRLGGKNAAPNVVAACQSCNHKRGKVLEKFVQNRFDEEGLSFIKESIIIVTFRLWKIWGVTSFREYWKTHGIPAGYTLTLQDELYHPIKSARNST